MMSKTTAIVLAAGKGKRMHSDLPKVLHQVDGRPMLLHVLSSIRSAGIPRIITVVGHGHDLVTQVLPPDILYAIQHEQKGTAHAVAQAAPLCPRSGSVLVVCGDTPLLSSATLVSLVEEREKTGASAVMLTVVLEDPTGYGRVLRDTNGNVQRVVEHRDASDDELLVREVNSGVFCFDAKSVFSALSEIRNDNVQGEYYLPDVLTVLSKRGDIIRAVVCSDPDEVAGINTIEQLEHVSAVLEQKRRVDENLDRTDIG